MGDAEVEALFVQTLVRDEDIAWAAISALRQDGSGRIFDIAKPCCGSGDPIQRAQAVTILCQLRRGGDSPQSRGDAEKTWAGSLGSLGNGGDQGVYSPARWRYQTPAYTAIFTA
jgi:hypothetical protein